MQAQAAADPAGEAVGHRPGGISIIQWRKDMVSRRHGLVRIIEGQRRTCCNGKMPAKACMKVEIQLIQVIGVFKIIPAAGSEMLVGQLGVQG